MTECNQCLEREEKISVLEAEKENWRMAVYYSIYYLGEPDEDHPPSSENILEAQKALMAALID